MVDRHEDFTPNAQTALAQAEAEARSFRHNYIGQEHLLVALLGLEEGTIPVIRDRFGIGADKVREAITQFIGLGTESPEGEIGFTPRLKRAVKLAVDEARAQGQARTGTPHLLIGLLLEGGGVGAGLLQSFGVTVEQVRELVRPTRWPRETLSEWAEQNRGLKRYLLTMPADLFQEVQDLADRQQTNVAELLRRFTRLGLLAARIQATPGASLVIREGDSEQRVLLL